MGKIVKVTSAQKLAAQMVVRRAAEKGETVSDAVHKVANAQPPDPVKRRVVRSGVPVIDADSWPKVTSTHDDDEPGDSQGTHRGDRDVAGEAGEPDGRGS